MGIKQIYINDKEITLYPAKSENGLLIVMNSFAGDGSGVWEYLNGDVDFNLLNIGNVNWNHDMSPWECAPIFKGEKPFTGGAREHLDLITGQILPWALSNLNKEPEHICIAGYSLAGLFAIYAMYNCSLFDRAASMSGSLWYPGFMEYVRKQTLKKLPERVYLSVGDREAKTKNAIMKTVQDNTEKLADHFMEMGIDVRFELNPGNHFADEIQRIAKGIRAML